jgi:hypothetical protein
MDSTTITSSGRGDDVTAGVSSICAAFQATATGTPPTVNTVAPC